MVEITSPPATSKVTRATNARWPLAGALHGGSFYRAMRECNQSGGAGPIPDLLHLTQVFFVYLVKLDYL